MYVRVLQDELQFPDDRGIDQDTKSLIRGVGSITFDYRIGVSLGLVTASSTEPGTENV
jgi:hypothetical protein